MKKVFEKKIISYVIIGILIALEIAITVSNWFKKSLGEGMGIPPVVMIAMLVLCAIAIWKNKNILLIISSSAMISVLVYVMASDGALLAQDVLQGKLPPTFVAGMSFFAIALLLFLGCFVLLIVRACKVTKHVKTINTIFSLCAACFILIAIILVSANGLNNVDYSVWDKVFWMSTYVYTFFFALLVTCIGHHLNFDQLNTKNA